MLSSPPTKPTRKRGDSSRDAATTLPIKTAATPAKSSVRQTKTYQPRASRLDDPRWQPFQNSKELALQVYDLTHPW